MVNELNALESKIAQVAALCRDLRVENIQLRQSLAAAKLEKSSLVERIEMARERLERLVQQLPKTQD
jgi:cell division protein ZapB